MKDGRQGTRREATRTAAAPAVTATAAGSPEGPVPHQCHLHKGQRANDRLRLNFLAKMHARDEG